MTIETSASSPRSGAGKVLTADAQQELFRLTARVRDGLRRSAGDIISIGQDLLAAKKLLGHGKFGGWLDAEFGLSHRSATQFMRAAERFQDRMEAAANLPGGVLLELASASVPDDLVDRVLAGDLPAKVSVIREARTSSSRDERAYARGASFVDYLERFGGTDGDLAAALAARVLRHWGDAESRDWVASAMKLTAELIEANEDIRVAPLEFPRTTMKRLRAQLQADLDEGDTDGT